MLLGGAAWGGHSDFVEVLYRDGHRPLPFADAGNVSHRGMRQVHHEPAAKGTDDEVCSQLHLHCQLKNVWDACPSTQQ